MVGRKPKSIKTQIAAGDPRKKGMGKLEQRLAAEPKASKGLPQCPRHLKGRARAAWNFWAEELAAMDIDCRPDAHMLEGACVAYDAAVASYQTILKEGRFFFKKVLDPQTKKLVVVDVKPHPAVRQGNASWTIMRHFCTEFGLSPVSRTRLAIDRQDEVETDLMALLSRPREKGTRPLLQ